MAEKRVSVRFAAVGGRELKAEMRSIGAEGRQALDSLERGAPGAAGGLNQVDSSATRARAELEQLAARATAAASAMQTTAAANTPMVARINEMTGVTRQSTAELLQHGQALDDMRARFNPLYAEIRNYRAAVSEVRAAHAEGAISADEMSAAIARLRTSSLATIDQIKGISAANREAARASDEAARAAAKQAQNLDNLRARYNPVYAATRQYRSSLADLRMMRDQNVISSQEFSAALEREAERMRASIAMANGQTTALQQMSRALRGATLRTQQLFFQLNDVGVSLAGGMNPFLVLAQQGTQVAQIYGFGNGGVGAIFRDLRGLITRTLTASPMLTAAIVGTAAAIGGMTYEINQTTDVAVGFGDTMLAVFQVVGRGIRQTLQPAVEAMAPFFSNVWDRIVEGVKGPLNLIINGFRTSVEVIKIAFGGLPGALGSLMVAAANAVVAGVERMINGVIDRINFFVEAANDALSSLPGFMRPGGQIGSIPQVDLPSVPNPWSDTAGGQAIEAAIAEGMSRDPMGGVFDSVRDQAIKNALAGDAEEKKGGGGGRKAAAKKLKDEVGDLIKSLKQELAVLRESDPIKKKMIEYADQLKGATAEQRKQVRALVVELDNAKHGWEAVGRSLQEYYQESKRIGGAIGQAFVSAFGSAENAIGEFVKTGKLQFGDLVSSLLADMAKLAARRFILGPISKALGGIFGGLTGPTGSIPRVDTPSIAGGIYAGGGYTGDGPRSGGLDGRGGFMAVVHPGERITDEYRGQKAPSRASGPTVININGVRDAESFRRSRSQIAADLQRGLSMGRRTM